MDDDIVFRGEGPCDVFLRRVRKVAFEKGKHKDGDWMAGYASTCFEGEALKWYEELDEEIRDDWNQLRKALLERFPLASEHSSRPTSEPSSSSNPMNCIPTAPAAPGVDSFGPRQAVWPRTTVPTAPLTSTMAAHPQSAPATRWVPTPVRPEPSTPPVPATASPPVPPLLSSSDVLDSRLGAPLRARLVVISDSPANRGYVGKSRIRGYYEVTARPEEALRVEYTPGGSGRPVEFRLLQLEEPQIEQLFPALPDIAVIADPWVPPSGLYVKTALSIRSGKPTTNVGLISVSAVEYYSLQIAIVCHNAKRLVFVADWSAYIKSRTAETSSYDKANPSEEYIMDDDILFSGEGPCDEFLRAVRKVAFGQGKHEDPEWIAGYVSTCFVGKALRWYEELDEDTQDDWKQLRKALLERFPPVSEDYPQPITESSSSSNPMNYKPTTLATPPAESLRFESVIRLHGTVPISPPISTAAAYTLLTPPSAPPIQALRTGKGTKPLPKIPATEPPLISPFSGVFNAPDSQSSAPIRGRLAVTYASAINRGYVAKSRIRGYYEITEDPNQALRVDCTPTGQPLDFRILDSLPEGDFDRLGMVWHDAEPKVEALSV
ncbi:hypothetical protein FRC01_001315, partial [Tulasnella sp. 417]